MNLMMVVVMVMVVMMMMTRILSSVYAEYHGMSDFLHLLAWAIHPSLPDQCLQLKPLWPRPLSHRMASMETSSCANDLAKLYGLPDEGPFVQAAHLTSCFPDRRQDGLRGWQS